MRGHTCTHALIRAGTCSHACARTTMRDERIRSRTHACMCTCSHTCMCMCMYARKCAQLLIRLYTCMHMHACLHACADAGMHTHMHTRMHACTHTRMHACTHAQTDARTHGHTSQISLSASLCCRDRLSWESSAFVLSREFVKSTIISSRLHISLVMVPWCLST